MAKLPKFKDASDEAAWWASPAGRNYVERQSAAAKAAGVKPSGSNIVARLNKNRAQTPILPPEGRPR